MTSDIKHQIDFLLGRGSGNGTGRALLDARGSRALGTRSCGSTTTTSNAFRGRRPTLPTSAGDGRPLIATQPTGGPSAAGTMPARRAERRHRRANSSRSAIRIRARGIKRCSGRSTTPVQVGHTSRAPSACPLANATTAARDRRGMPGSSPEARRACRHLEPRISARAIASPGPVRGSGGPSSAARTTRDQAAHGLPRGEYRQYCSALRTTSSRE
jgi:hypothetical protein